MNIKSRLKTLEKKVIKPFSAFCLCYGENLKDEVIPITIDEWKRRFDTGEERLVRLPDACERCGKPVDKRLSLVILARDLYSVSFFPIVPLLTSR